MIGRVWERNTKNATRDGSAKRPITHAVRASVFIEVVYLKFRIDATRVKPFEALLNETRRTMTFGVQNGVQLARSRRPVLWLRGAESTVCGIFNSSKLKVETPFRVVAR